MTRWGRLCAAGAVAELLTELRAAAEAAEGAGYDREAALKALGEADPGLWLSLDRAARTVEGAPLPAGEADPLRLLLAAMDRDGRTRQAAVEGLAHTGGPLVATALALRTADWVEQVRERAVEALALRSAPDEAAAAVRMLLRLRGRRRAAGALAAYREVLAAPEARRAVRALAAGEEPQTRRFGVELALELGEFVRGDLVRTALRDPDQMCRRLCAQRLLELDPDQAGRLLWARSAAVRELAVAALPEDVPAARLTASLADPARIVRAQARWRLYSRGEPPALTYRRQLVRCGPQSPPRLVAGLALGLGECGDGTDVPLLLRLVREARTPWPPVVRRAAVRAVGRLAPREGLLGLLGPLATDTDPGVAREAFEALARVAGEVPPETVWFGRTRPEPAVRKAAERLRRSAQRQAQSGHRPR
ncbi:HEAT repeat domain-containing protein [Streptomyces sp. NPDC058691]|uniref:HEAT repeat domain-containing protein n=1 Tax=Streptomyces sp. NPDC058691 TaxID=3346601 RepID=UPI003655C9C8